jgi:hypothetical protein
MSTESKWLDDDPALEELAQVDDADELCRRLLESAWGWGSSSRYAEAVELLGRVHRTGTLPEAFLALLLCTCRRWGRVTAKLIVAIEGSGLLSDADLDELAESLLSEEVVIEHPLTWVSPQWLGVDLSDGTTQTVAVDEDTMAQTERRPEPPLRRWAATRALRNDPGRLDELLTTAEALPPRHRDALLHGLLDAAAAVEEGDRGRLVRRGLRCGTARVRRAALDRLCELHGPGVARRRASSDADRTVRAWQPPTPSPPG